VESSQLGNWQIQSFPRSTSGSLAKFAAMRRASSLVSSLAAGSPTGLVLKIEIAERLPGIVADDAR